jgi:hypothetical protein
MHRVVIDIFVPKTRYTFNLYSMTVLVNITPYNRKKGEERRKSVFACLQVTEQKEVRNRPL